MNLKRLGSALAGVCVLAVVLASNACAAATTTDVKWYTGAAPGSELTNPETVGSLGSGELITSIGGTKLQLKFTGLECIFCEIENFVGVAFGNGRLKFTGVTVAQPSNCKVDGGARTTALLILLPDFMIGSTDYWKFEPASGTTFATVKLETGTGTCPLSGTYILSGTQFVQVASATGVQAVGQNCTSSGAINTTAGGALKFGSAAAELNSSAVFTLNGAKKGAPFGTH